MYRAAAVARSTAGSTLKSQRKHPQIKLADYKIEDGLAPSYFIEGLLYNVPVDRFGGGDPNNFIDVLSWLLAADRSKFVCANEMFYLYHPTALETWRVEKCDRFLNALSNLSDTWGR